jgi:broad specificity phosphatase PhoE
MSAEIYIARHGQDEDNANGLLNGHRNKPLTEIGRQQAHELAKGILDIDLNFDRVYSSPLQRALETAQIICEELDIKNPIKIMPGLIERDFGICSGMPITEVLANAGEDVLRTTNITYVLNFDGGETFPEVEERARAVLKEVRQENEDGRVLLVCHGDIGKMVYAAATGLSWLDVLHHFHFGNGDLVDVNGPGDVHKIKLPQYNQ